jgi:hypothetical protein
MCLGILLFSVLLFLQIYASFMLIPPRSIGARADDLPALDGESLGANLRKGNLAIQINTAGALTAALELRQRRLNTAPAQ